MAESVDQGRPLLVEAIEVLEELGDFEEFAIANEFLGDIDWREGEFDSSLGELLPRPRRYARSHRLPAGAETSDCEGLAGQGQVQEAAQLAEEGHSEVAKDDWATVASTAMVLGEVRAAQGRNAEAEELLRKAADVIAPTEFPKFDVFAALADFLVGKGEIEEGLRWLAKARESVPEFPVGSPVHNFQERRAQKIEAEAAAMK